MNRRWLENFYTAYNAFLPRAGTEDKREVDLYCRRYFAARIEQELEAALAGVAQESSS